MRFSEMKIGQHFRFNDDPSNIFMKADEIEDDYGFIDNAIIVKGKSIGPAHCFSENDEVFII